MAVVTTNEFVAHALSQVLRIPDLILLLIQSLEDLRLSGNENDLDIHVTISNRIMQLGFNLVVVAVHYGLKKEESFDLVKEISTAYAMKDTMNVRKSVGEFQVKIKDLIQ